jgi:uncharacterized protein (DUF362 family)
MTSGRGFDWERRTFCRDLVRRGLWATGIAAFGPWVGTSRAAAPDLAAVQGPAAQAVRKAVSLLGGMGRFVRPGQRVVVKPNIGFARVPEQAANTNPAVVAEVARLALEAGAREVVVFDRSSDDPARCYRMSGIEAAVQALADARAKIFIPNAERYVPVKVPGGKSLENWPIYEDAARADVYINCPVAKHHVMCGLTMGLKNVMGVIGGNRSMIHDGFDDKLLDLNLARPSHLTVLDATRILLSGGPEGGSLLNVGRPNLVIAGTDVVAVDAYACRLFGAKPDDISYLHRAAARGIGQTDVGRVSLREEAL